MPFGLVRLYVQCGAPVSQLYPLNLTGLVRSGTCLSWWSAPHKILKFLRWFVGLFGIAEISYGLVKWSGR